MTFGPSNTELAKVEEDLGYEFKDKWLLRQAFFHPSVGEFNNNRLAWIGDSVMSMSIAQMAFEFDSTASCEVLHDRRQVMAMREFCAEGCKQMGWDKLAVCGKCFPKNQTELNMNMLAEMFEAVWGAQFIDTQGDYAQSLASYQKNFPLDKLTGIFDAIAESKKEGAEARALEKKEAEAQAKREAQLALLERLTSPVSTLQSVATSTDGFASVADLLGRARNGCMETID